MAAHYTSVTIDEFRATLTAERGWVVDETGGEFVFVRSLATIPGASIKVFTSIPVHHAASRGVGRDAIRVCAVMNGTGLVKASRVHRTQNWRDNLLARVQSVFEKAKVHAKYRLRDAARASAQTQRTST